MDDIGKQREEPNIPATQATAQLRTEHRRETTRLQRSIDRLTRIASHPLSVPVLIIFIAVWVAGNLLATRFGFMPVDPPPFPWLQAAISTASLCVAVLLVSTQRREAQLADRRAHLILEMAILAEQKSAKTIQLLEEYRRDNPLVSNRPDHEATVMSSPADHQIVLDAIKREEDENQDLDVS